MRWRLVVLRVAALVVLLVAMEELALAAAVPLHGGAQLAVEQPVV